MCRSGNNDLIVPDLNLKIMRAGCHLLTRREASSPFQRPIKAMPIAVVSHALDIGPNSDKDEEENEKPHLIRARRTPAGSPRGRLSLPLHPVLRTAGPK